MMITKLILSFLVALMPLSAVLAVDGVECAMAVYQYDVDNGRKVLLHEDTAQFIEGVAAIGSMLAFSVDVEVTAIDTGSCTFMLHVVTIDQPAANYSRQFNVEYGLPASLTNISGKGDVEYALTVTPIKPVDIDTTFCGYLHIRGGDFSVDPTAHLNLHFVDNTHGDFFWNAVKGIMETEYRRFKAMNNFTLPGKYELYLAPCPIKSVIWDKRFYTMVDPTRSLIVSLYSTSANSTHPFVVLYASILRNYGYAPPFLSEGFAGYQSDAVIGMRRRLEADPTISLRRYLDTPYYLTADPETADEVAASFVRYLIDAHDLGRFQQVYKQAHDLNLRDVLAQTYDLTISELETEWKAFVDTLTIPDARYRYFADLAEAMFNYDEMRGYAQELVDHADNRLDSLMALPMMVRASYFNGNYYDAAEYQEAIARLDTANAAVRMALGGYHMMNGFYEKALENFNAARERDTLDRLADFNAALAHLYTGDTAQAKELFELVVTDPTPNAPRVEAQILLSDLLLFEGGEANIERANALLRAAVSRLSNPGPTGPTPQQQLWGGIAYLLLDDTGTAGDFLQTALFLETRPLYRGMINLWLGKLSDIRGEHDVARQFYSRVLAEASADYHQKEATRYLETPYTR